MPLFKLNCFTSEYMSTMLLKHFFISFCLSTLFDGVLRKAPTSNSGKSFLISFTNELISKHVPMRKTIFGTAEYIMQKKPAL